jgi:hypothetical protein
VIFAHVGGIPVEEGLLGVAPALCAAAVLVRFKVKELVGWRRRR